MRLFAILLGLVLLAPISVEAETWPARPVKVIVPYAPGGATDGATRPFMERLSVYFGQQFVIENKGGASGAIGTEAGAKAPPDGYTLFMAPTATVTIVPQARKTPYDVFKDMVPIGRYAEAIHPFAIHPSVPANTLQEFIAYAKANPGKLHFGSSGLGTMTQMCLEVLKKMAGVDIVHVPYRGGAKSLTDLLAGHVQAYCEPIVIPQVKAGKARLLAVAARERMPEFPDVPTFAEVLPGYDVGTWMGLFAPAKTPQPIIQAVSAAMNKAAQDPDMKPRLAGIAARPLTDTPEEFAVALKSEYEKYGKIVRDLGVKME